MNPSQAGPYAALVPVVVNILVNLAKPLFGGIRDQQTHDNAIRALAYLLSALVAAGFTLATSPINPQAAINVFFTTFYGGSAAIALFHVAQKATVSAGPAVALGPLSFGVAPAIPAAPAIDFYQPVPPPVPARPAPPSPVPPVAPMPPTAPVPWPSDPSEGGPHARPERGPSA